jgi:hypothetical protein
MIAFEGGKNPWEVCPVARRVLGWPKRSKLARAFLWEYSYKG